MTSVEQSVDVAVPVRTAYDRWTRFEDFPRFMQGVERIEQRTPTRTHWVTRIAGVQREFDAEVSEQIPDERIAWHAVDGPAQSGVVTFHRLDDTHTRVMLQMAIEPSGVVEQAGDKLGLIRTRIHGDLRNFKGFVEGTGAGGGRGGQMAAPGTAPYEAAAPEAAGPNRPAGPYGAPLPDGAGPAMPATGAAPGPAEHTRPLGPAGRPDRTDPLSPYADDYEPYRDEEP